MNFNIKQKGASRKFGSSLFLCVYIEIKIVAYLYKIRKFYAKRAKMFPKVTQMPFLSKKNEKNHKNFSHF